MATMNQFDAFVDNIYVGNRKMTNDYCYICQNVCKKDYDKYFMGNKQCKKFEDNYKPIKLIHTEINY